VVKKFKALQTLVPTSKRLSAMSLPKMKLLASAIALLGAFTTGALGNLADGKYYRHTTYSADLTDVLAGHEAVTETIAAQELGSTTVDGK
jgi:hypothetical protein